MHKSMFDQGGPGVDHVLPMPAPIGFTPKATVEENYAAAWDWLGKALKYEQEKKPNAHVEMALKRACHYENAWFAMRPAMTRVN